MQLYIFIVIFICCVFITRPSAAGFCSSNQTVSSNGNCWKFVNISMSWHNAMNFCISENQQMASILNDTDVQTFSLLGKSFDQNWVWTNLMANHSTANTSEYQMWYNLTHPYVTPPYMPNSKLSLNNNLTECIKFDVNSTMTDVDCNTTIPFICTNNQIVCQNIANSYVNICCDGSATVTCNSGFFLSGNSSTTCNTDTREWLPAVSCIPQCPNASDKYPNITYSDMNKLNGSNATAQCPQTSSATVGLINLICTNQTWVPDYTSCNTAGLSTTVFQTTTAAANINSSISDLSTTSTNTQLTSTSLTIIKSDAPDNISTSLFPVIYPTYVKNFSTTISTITTAAEETTTLITTKSAANATYNNKLTIISDLSTILVTFGKSAPLVVSKSVCNPNPCLNGGTCLSASVCKCNSGFSGTICTTKNVLSGAEWYAVKVIHPLGCTILILCVSACFVLFLLFRNFTVERVLQMGQEVSLIVSHAIILTQIFHAKDQIACLVIAVSLQFFTITNFAFMALESLQTFSILQNVVSIGGFFTRKTNIILGLGIPAFIIIFTVPFFPFEYISEHSCWINYYSNMKAATFLPLIACTVALTVLTEAGTILDAKRFPLTTEEKFYAALFRQKGAVFVISLNWASLLTGSLAVFNRSLSAYSVVFAINVTLGVYVFIYHTFCNDQVYNWLKQKICRKSKKQTK